MDSSPPVPVAPVPAPAPSPGGLLQQNALPTPVKDVPVVPALTVAPKHFLAAFFLSFFLGIFGADRFYLGYYGQGVLKLLTLGWFGIGSIVDLGIILGGGMRTAKGEQLVGYDEYIGLAKKTIKWLTVGGVAVVAVIIISAVIAWQFLASSGLLNLISTGLGAESGGALTLPTGSSGTSGSSSSSSTGGGTSSQELQDLLKQLQ